MRTHSRARRALAATCTALLAVALLAGCSADDDSATSSADVMAPGAFSGATEATTAAAGDVADRSGAGGGEAASSGNSAPAAAPIAGRQVIRTATMTVTVEERQFRTAYDRAARLATELGGFIADSDAQASGDATVPQSGQITMRVPVDRFDEARSRLAALGVLKGESIAGQDVTDQLVDLDARVTTLQAQEEAYRNLLGRAESIGDVLQVQEQLFSVRTQIEQLQAQAASLQDRAALSTITVTIEEPAAPGPGDDDRDGLGASWDRAKDAFTGVIGGLLVAAAALLPIAVLVLVLGAVTWPIVRRSRRRRAGAQASIEPGTPTRPPAAG